MDRSTPITLFDFSFRYPSSTGPVLKGIHLEIPKGEVVGIMGPAGAGKSTLVFALGGQIPDFIHGTHSGTITVGAQNPITASPRTMADTIGIVFQDFESQLFSSTVELEIAFAMENRGVDPESMRRRVREIEAIIGLSGFSKRPPGSLSGGQKQRLVIGSVLALNPEILCFDEPTTDLDPAGKEEVFSLIRSLCRSQHHAPGEEAIQNGIIIEQETEEMAALDRLILMDKGTIIADGPPKAVMKDISLFQQLGLRPLPVCEYFAALGIESSKQLLSVPDAVSLFHASDLEIDTSRYQEIIKADSIRTQRYGPEIISIRGVSFGYEDNLVIRNLNLTIRRQECLAIAGANGSGKTTVSRLLAGLIHPDSGSVTVAGMDTQHHSIHDLSRVIGYVFQNPDHQIFSDTVFEEVAYGVRLHGFSPDQVSLRVAEALLAVGMEGKEDYDPFSLPRGDRQRVAVASVLAIQPDIIILDEPTTGLDYQDQVRMMELVADLNQKGHTIIIITHAMWVLAEYMHRVVLLRDGEIIADGTPRTILSNPPLLAENSMKAPQITEFSTKIGYPICTVDEMAACTRRRDGA